MDPRRTVLLFAVAPATLAAPGALASQQRQAVGLDRIGAAELLERTDDGLVPLPVLDGAVELDVTGVMAHGKVTQRFVNPSERVIEVLYAFPLPDDAAVYRMEMRIGDRTIVSRLEEREQARRTYERAREEGKKTALLEQQRPNLFTTRAANVNPGETLEIELEYYQEAAYRDGGFELRFPLTFIERFGAPAENETGWRPTASPTTPSTSLELTLVPGFELDELVSPSHPVEIVDEGENWRVTSGLAGLAGDRDFVLRWRPRRGAAHRGAFFVEERGGERYALAIVLPPAADSEAALGLPTETLFIVDVSGSMAGASIRQARHALRAALGRLRPEDRFNILVFNDGNRAFSENAVQAEERELARAKRWVDRLDAGGGTEIYDALMRGIGMMGDSSGSHARRIVFLTDGAVANEQRVLNAVTERLGEIRLHAVGLGHAPNAWLMRKMAQQGRGLHEFIASVDEAGNRIDRFFERLDRPVLADLRLEWQGAGADAVEPSRLPDLHAGEPLRVSARLEAGRALGRLRVGGYGRDGWVETVVDTTVSGTAEPGLGLRWARARVESILDGLYEGVDEALVREQVLDLAFRHHLVTRYTSLVAVEEWPTALEGATAVRADAALARGGTDGPLRLRVGIGLVLLGALWLGLARPR